MGSPIAERGISRRQLLKGAVLGAAGLGAAAILGCGGEPGLPATPDTSLTKQGPGATPKPPESVKEKVPVFLSRVFETKSNSPAWKNVNVDFSIVNNTGQYMTIGDIRKFGAATLTTSDGYTYKENPKSIITMGLFTDKGYRLPILPPGFRANFLAGDWYNNATNPKLLTYSFRAAQATSGYKLSIQGVPAEFDLSKDVQPIHYPTDIPNSDFRDVGKASFIFSENQKDRKGIKITFDSFSPVGPNPNLLDPSIPYKLYSLKGTAENQSKGYDAAAPVGAFENVFLVANDGGVYLGKGEIETKTARTGSWTIPFVGLSGLEPSVNSQYGSQSGILTKPIDPEQTIQFEVGIIVAKEVGKAKLILPAMNNTILNLNL